MKYTSFQEIIEQGKQNYGDAPAVRFINSSGMLHELSYKELYERVMDRVQRLKETNCSCVGIYGPASPEWIIDFFAAPIAGKRTVLLDPAMTREETQRRITDFEIEAVLPSNVGFMTVKEGTASKEACGDILVFSSGTTSADKAVVLSQKALAYSAWNGQQMLACGKDDVIVAMLPLNHVFGLVCTVLWPLCNGAVTALGRGMRYYTEDPAAYHTTILVMVPTLLNYLLATESFSTECHTILLGAAPCSERVFQAIREKKIRLSYGYGLSETASGLAISVDAEDPAALDLCPDTKITIAEDGEVLVETPCMMEGYWRKPEDTAAVLQNGVLHTGDLGELDEQNRLHLKGRKNDVLVLFNGEKVYLPEVEQKLNELLDEEAALVLLYDTLTIVVGHNKDADAVKQAVDQFNETQPLSKRIMNIRVIEGSLPRTATGKLKRWKLEELL